MINVQHIQNLEIKHKQLITYLNGGKPGMLQSVLQSCTYPF